MTPQELQARTTSVAPNYRAARRARSRQEFIAKVGVVVEESDESNFWLVLSVAASQLTEDRAAALIRESQELTAIFARTVVTARERLKTGTNPTRRTAEPQSREPQSPNLKSPDLKC